MITRHSGFTLLEMLVVLALLAMIYALIPADDRRRRFDRRTQGGRPPGGGRPAQSAFPGDRQPGRGDPDPGCRGAQLSAERRRASPRNLPQQAEIGVYTAQGEVVDASTAAIRFYPDGSSTGGRVSLAMGERKFLVDVDWLTGQVEILDTP